MFSRIEVLKRLGYEPDAILDIGAHHGNWTASMYQIYPDCNYYLFEGIDYAELNRFRAISGRNAVGDGKFSGATTQGVANENGKPQSLEEGEVEE